MPRAKFDHIVSCSSEDSAHNANNLLNNDISKKWKCKSPGESSATVIIQLNKSYKITGIDIGNENSSFIEVFVGRSSSPQESNYQILLAMSSFMTPMEARDLTNCNRVRLFTAKDFAKPACEEKWDRIKVVCTQPFNKNVQYGLTFIVAHTSEENASDTIDLGKFTLKRSDSPEYIAPGNLFAKRNEITEDTEKLPAALEMKRASTSEWLEKHGAPKCKPANIKPTSSNDNSKKTQQPKPNTDAPKFRNSLDLYYEPEDDEPNDKIDAAMDKLKEERKRRKELEVNGSKKTKKKNDTPRKADAKSPQASTSKNGTGTNLNATPGPSATKRKQKDKTMDTPKKKAKVERRLFYELLSGVVFTISGIQNPERASLRARALEMGARYKPDWDQSCTHLICAFANTPKFNQVRGKGKIVTKSWIDECHKQRKRLPWRRYALDRNDQGKSESEDEISEETWQSRDEDAEVSDSDNKEKETDLQADEPKEFKEDKSPFDADTDEEELEKQLAKVPDDLPKLFTNQMFYVDNNFNVEEKDKLERIIKALNGFVMHRIATLLDFIITKQTNVNELKSRCPTAKCVNSKWIYECADKQKLVPYENYILNAM